MGAVDLSTYVWPLLLAWAYRSLATCFERECPRDKHSQISTRQKPQGSWWPILRNSITLFHHMLLVKWVTKASPDLRGGKLGSSSWCKNHHLLIERKRIDGGHLQRLSTTLARTQLYVIWKSDINPFFIQCCHWEKNREQCRTKGVLLESRPRFLTLILILY